MPAVGARPLVLMVKSLEHHGEAREIPDNGSEGAQPVTPKHNLIALQGNDEEVDAKQLIMDGECEHGADPQAVQSLTISDPHCHAVLGYGPSVQAARHLSCHEAMCVTIVDQGGERLVMHQYGQMNGLICA
jgi:hypothetical protein